MTDKTATSTSVAQHVDGSWGFWDETWTDFIVGYDSQEDAERACRGYCDADLDGRENTADAEFYRRNPGRLVGIRVPIRVPTPETSTTRRPTSPGAERWLGVRVPVLDHGYVELLDYCGNDAEIVKSARVTTSTEGRSWADDVSLLRYLFSHRHTTPVEMGEVRFQLKMPIFVARQWIRHRTANINEQSLRYADAHDDLYVPPPRRLARQSASNRQGSGELLLGEEAERARDHFTDGNHEAHDHYRRLRDDHDLSREVARSVLPLGTYTSLVWKIDLHNLLHFLGLRLDPHAQEEMRAYARAIAVVVEAWVPECWRAFVDYRLEARSFSRVELLALAAVLARRDLDARPIRELALEAGAQAGLKGRELAEFGAKIDHVAGLPALDQAGGAG